MRLREPQRALRTNVDNLTAWDDGIHDEIVAVQTECGGVAEGFAGDAVAWRAVGGGLLADPEFGVADIDGGILDVRA